MYPLRRGGRLCCSASFIFRYISSFLSQFNPSSLAYLHFSATRSSGKYVLQNNFSGSKQIDLRYSENRPHGESARIDLNHSNSSLPSNKSDVLTHHPELRTCLRYLPIVPITFTSSDRHVSSASSFTQRRERPGLDGSNTCPCRTDEDVYIMCRPYLLG